MMEEKERSDAKNNLKKDYSLCKIMKLQATVQPKPSFGEKASAAVVAYGVSIFVSQSIMGA
jgi:hypothetical protein